jgi:hypothetical protein
MLELPPNIPEILATDLVRCCGQAVEEALKAGESINGAATAGLRAIYTLGRQHGAAQLPAPKPAPVVAELSSREVEAQEAFTQLRDEVLNRPS